VYKYKNERIVNDNMEKYSHEELEKIIQQYELSQFQTCQKVTSSRKAKKPVSKITCEICSVEISCSGLKVHQKSKRHLFLTDIQAISKELQERLNSSKIDIYTDE